MFEPNCLLHHIMGTLSIEQQIYKRFVKFLSNNIISGNKTIKICVQLALNGSGSVVSNNLSLICYTYKIPKRCNTNFISLFAKQTCNSGLFDYDLFVSNMIRELLYMRDYKSTSF